MAQTYICSATRLRVHSPLHLLPFLRSSALSAIAARRTPGAVRTRLLGLPPLMVFHTLTVWESEEAMMEFVTTPAHRKAMAGMETWARHGRFVRFTSDTPRVGWRRAMRELREPDGNYQRGVGYARKPESSIATATVPASADN
jgi:hypothetical protein